MTDTITWAFTHKVKSRADLVTTECGISMRGPGWIDQGTNCPDCYPGTTYPRAPRPDAPITYGTRRR